jgi:uncharacterized membrane protein YedE/YeeE
MQSALTPLWGGVLIGLAALTLWLGNGRTAGVSGIVGGIVRPQRGDVAWRVAFVAGLVLAGVCGHVLRPGSLSPSPRPLALLACAGLFVGAGTRIGSGCTSGHGVCGIGRGSRRSLVATLVFVATGVLAVTLLRLWGIAA